MTDSCFHLARSCEPFDPARIPVMSISPLRAETIKAVASGMRIASFFGMRSGDSMRLVMVLADDRDGLLRIGSSEVDNSYPALTPDCPQAHWFEREIAEQWGIVPEGHPWLKPIRFHKSFRADHDAWNRQPDCTIEPGVTNFFSVEGSDIHEVAVGPVHAGVIEPGHFRFQCFGENVLHLEISLGYQHRGIERALNSGMNRRAPHFFETAAGDTTIGHALAWAQGVESASGTQVPARAHAIRAIALELERLANHTGDLGALAGDVGFLPTSSFCGRLRGDLLNMTALICGNRFGRHLVRPGGVKHDLSPPLERELLKRLAAAKKEISGALDLMFDTPSVLARFEETGTLAQGVCETLGLVGPAARASSCDRDVRRDHPSGFYRFQQMPVSSAESGDVLARAVVRRLEIDRSITFVHDLLGQLPGGPVLAQAKPKFSTLAVVSLVEGWRGEICHVSIPSGGKEPAVYKIVDPSFHNWAGLAMAMRDQQISDFPLCNKSFNLSYCGHDL